MNLQELSPLAGRLSEIPEELLRLVPEHLAVKYRLLPYKEADGSLYVYSPAGAAAAALQSWLHRSVMVTDCSAAELERGLLLNYRLRPLLPLLNAEIAKAARAAPLPDKQTSPLSELVECILAYAVLQRASDIHLEPLADSFTVRFRIDGQLYTAFTFPAALHPAVVSRLKIMAGRDIAEKRLPQDGRIIYHTSGGEYELRLSTLPSLYGENVVLRLLPQRCSLPELSELGFADASLAQYRQLLKRPWGLIICCGATGCGKTTTMYASLQELAAAAVNIVTVEDPIERSLPSVIQCSVNLKAGFDFAAGLRAILRQDPDIILVGEIRDEETAQMAVRAAITGHLVMATLHTNDAVSASLRLIDMGVKPFLLADALIGILAQRLVRCRCRACGGKGCSLCGHTGYHGRTAVYELLTVDAAVRQHIRNNAEPALLAQAALANGMVPLRQAAAAKAAAGITTAAEIGGLDYA